MESRKWLLLVIVLVSYFSAITAHFYDQDLAGDYCAGSNRQQSRCCDGRVDTCAVPLLGTLCYCDQFCNRTDSSDCCPDYWSVCLGIQPSEELVQQPHGTSFSWQLTFSNSVVQVHLAISFYLVQDTLNAFYYIRNQSDSLIFMLSIVGYWTNLKGFYRNCRLPWLGNALKKNY